MILMVMKQYDNRVQGAFEVCERHGYPRTSVTRWDAHRSLALGGWFL